MSDFLKKFFFAPTFEDERTSRSARYLNSILNLGFLLVIVLIISGQYAFVVNIAFLFMAIFMLGMHLLLHAGKVKLTSALFVMIIWSGMTYLAWIGGGVKDFGLIIYLILIFLASLLGYIQLSGLLIALSILSIWVLYYAETRGFFVPVAETLLADTFSLTSIFVLFGAILYFTITDLEGALSKSKEGEQELIARNETLLKLQEELQENTRNLELTSEKTQAQALRLQAIAKIAQKIALTKNTEALLPEIVKQTRESFDFYYVALYLLSADKKHLHLKATNIENDQKTSSQNKQVEVGQTNVVSKVAYYRKPYVIFDDGDDAVDSNDPDLPETHSQMVLPLIYGNALLGVFDIHSKVHSAFDESDVEAFSIFANQIAIVIENTYQLERAQNALAEMEEISRNYIRQEWSQLLKSKRERGALYVHGDVENIEENQVLEQGGEGVSSITIPVKLRNEIIGTMKVSSGEKDHTWKKEDIELVQAIAERAALALENARLLEDTQRRANKEGVISQFANTISEVSQTEKLMSVAVSELQKILQATEVSFELDDIE